MRSKPRQRCVQQQPLPTGAPRRRGAQRAAGISRPPPPQLPPLHRRAVGVVGGHLDAIRRAGLAGLSIEPFARHAGSRRLRLRDPGARRWPVGRRDRGPRQHPPAADLHPGRRHAPGLYAGGVDLQRPRAGLAGRGDGSAPGRRQRLRRACAPGVRRRHGGQGRSAQRHRPELDGLQFGPGHWTRGGRHSVGHGRGCVVLHDQRTLVPGRDRQPAGHARRRAGQAQGWAVALAAVEGRLLLRAPPPRPPGAVGAGALLQHVRHLLHDGHAGLHRPGAPCGRTGVWPADLLYRRRRGDGGVSRGELRRSRASRALALRGGAGVSVRAWRPLPSTPAWWAPCCWRCCSAWGS